MINQEWERQLNEAETLVLKRSLMLSNDVTLAKAIKPSELQHLHQ